MIEQLIKLTESGKAPEMVRFYTYETNVEYKMLQLKVCGSWWDICKPDRPDIVFIFIDTLEMWVQVALQKEIVKRGWSIEANIWPDMAVVVIISPHTIQTKSKGDSFVEALLDAFCKVVEVGA